MRFNQSRLDGDPSYAPGRVIYRGNAYWRPSKADLKAGYAVTSVKLDGDDLAIAAKCRELTRELLLWRQGQPKVQPGTWGWVIGRYKSDEFSDFNGVKENTREGYLFTLSRWEEAIGEVLVSETDYPRIKLWQRAMEQKGRSTSYIHRLFTMLRMIAKHGRKIAPKDFRDVCDILSTMRVKSPKPRTVSPTAEQVVAVIAKADAAGASMFALGLSIQWWLSFRAVDVRGQWLGKGDRSRWADGLTWDMIDLEAGTIRKMASKTERHDDRPMVLDLTPLPDLVARIEAIPADRRVGPVITGKDGKPFKERQYRNLWRRYARAAGVPDEVQLLDVRAGALNDGLISGADRTELQHAANHKDGKTTERYIRARDVGANNVIALRTGTKA